MSEFQPENLHEAWELLAYKYIQTKGSYTEELQKRNPEAFETWKLITRLYDTYEADSYERLYDTY